MGACSVLGDRACLAVLIRVVPAPGLLRGRELDHDQPFRLPAALHPLPVSRSHEETPLVFLDAGRNKPLVPSVLRRVPPLDASHHIATPTPPPFQSAHDEVP